MCATGELGSAFVLPAMLDCEVLLQWLASESVLCHTEGMKNEIEILASPPLPVMEAVPLPPPPEAEAYTGLEWLTDEAWADCWEIHRHDRALFAKH